MQPLQQLQWKRSQVQTRLLSRKRKLAELFSVTAAEDLDDYKRQLQAFQDANDLESGRHFDEATLPPRRHSTRLTRRSQTSQPLADTLSSRPTQQRQKSPAKADRLLSPAPSQTSRASSSGRASPLPSSRTQKARSTRTEDGQDIGGCDEPPMDGFGRVNGAGEEDLLQSSNAIPRPLSPSLSVTLPDPPHIEGSGKQKDGMKKAESPSRSTQLKPAANQARRSRSPLVLAPVTNGADPQSSPASTEGPGSSHTPAPDGGSPNTSPEDDSTVTPRTFNQPKSDRPKGLDIPKRPDTPDLTQEVTEQEPSAMEVDHVEDTVDGEVPAEGPRDGESVPGPTQDPASTKPSMRIDTQTDINFSFRPVSDGSMVETPGQLTATATPRRQPPPPTPSVQDSSKRATRISSGVLQKKSVSEILGETPKGMSMTDSLDDGGESSMDPQARLLERERRDRERAKLSTVVFAKPQKQMPDGDTIELTRAEARETHKRTPSERDYLYTLFENKAYSMTRQGSMTYLIQNAHKTLSTADHLVDYQMQTECRVLKRIYQLQEKQRWALRQYKRAEEAPRPTSHWDFLLDHAKWMRTDFREERKWKLAAARGLAECCAEWVVSSPEERKQLQIRVQPPRIRPTEPESQDVDMGDGPGPAMSSQPTPELVASHDDDSMSDDIADPRAMPSTIAPAAIFSLGASEFNFSVDKTPAFDKLLNELPLYEPSSIEPDLSTSNLAEKLDSRWKTDIVPVSKYAVEKLYIKEYQPPVKRSRYDYDLESSPTRKTEPMPPQDQNVALFMTENKHIRDRIHPGHSFRPPSEHPMPSQAFFETRSSSQWTHTEDDELRKLVKDFSYNWSLISSCLTPRSLYSSGADRRTPWECFERWIGLEGLPADMSKTPYFKTYSGRIEAAGRHVAAQIEEAQRRAGANVPIPARKRTTQPVRVDRKRTQRHLAMLDVMRKLAKKRETAVQKQQHQADLAAMRKVSEVNQPKAPFKKPSEYAALRQERDQKRAEQAEIYRQQLIAHQRAAAQAQRGQNPQANGMPNGVPAGNAMRPPSNGMPGMPNGNLQVPNGHPRPHPAMMAAMNGVQIPPGMMGPKNLAQAQAQIQAGMARGITSPQQMRMMQEASKVQQEQLMRQAQQQAQQGGPHSSPNNPHAAMANGQGMNNAAYMAAMANANGAPSPSGMNGNSSSPRAQNAVAGQLSSGHVPMLTQLKTKYREQYPTATDDEIQRLATQQLTAWQQQATAAAAGQAQAAQKRQQPHNQAALNAAMGAVNAGAHSANNAALAAAQYGQGMMTNEQVQQYNNQRMRMSQAQAAQRGMPAQMQQQGMMGNMGTSPVMNMARPVSQHSQMSRSATPGQRSNSQSNMGGQQGSPRPGSSAMQT